MGQQFSQLSQEVVVLPAAISGPAKQTVYPGHYAWPELRVSRRAAWKERGNQDWNYHLNDLGNRNRRRGSARVLGEVACTYISDQEMRAMLLAKDSNLRRDPKHAKDVYRAMGRRMNQFITETTRDHQNVDKLLSAAETFGCPPGQVGHKDTGISRAWIKSGFEVGSLEAFGRHGVGVSLSGNDELAYERRELIRYLRREEKLNTALIDNDWEPHAIIFDTRPDLKAGELALRFTEARPLDIILAAPYACSED